MYNGLSRGLRADDLLPGNNDYVSPLLEFVAFRAYLVYPEKWRASGATSRSIGMTTPWAFAFIHATIRVIGMVTCNELLLLLSFGCYFYYPYYPCI